EDALLDLHDRVASLAQLRLDLGAELHGLLARLDLRLPPGRFRVARSIGEEDVPLAAGGVDPGAADEAEREERPDGPSYDSDHDCRDDEHARSYGLTARTRGT